MPAPAESLSRPLLDPERFPPVLPDRLYHATREEFLPSIMLHGLRTSHCGRIHGSMAIRPPRQTVYLSRHPNSNNLNTQLFASSSRIVVLEIDTTSLTIDAIYPDDFLFVGFGLEMLFDEADEVAASLGINPGEAQALLQEWENTLDRDLADKMRWLWPWYLHEHGEISVAQDIPASAIVAVRDYEPTS